METLFNLISGTGGIQMAIPALALIGLISAAASAAGTGIAQNKKRKALAGMRSDVAGDRAANNAWYSANALSDYTQRADAQNMFRHLRENLKSSRDTTTATAAVTGATPAAVAAAKETDAKTISNIYGNVAAMGQQYKDNVTNQYLNRQAWLRNAMLGLDSQELENYQRTSDAWGNIANTGLNTAAGAFKQ
jgi:hypothetical protein